MKRTEPARHDGRKVILGAIAAIILLAAGVVLTAYFSERTGMRNPTPLTAPRR